TIIRFNFTENTEKEEIVFSVEDNGTGINREDYENIFRIFQEGAAPQAENDSFGFSLNICNKIVRNHGGKLWFTSNVGKGTTFHFSLPLTQNSQELVSTQQN
ncbi:MAG: ATP-binding protein, partial [Bacteroidota bacterium]